MQSENKKWGSAWECKKRYSRKTAPFSGHCLLHYVLRENEGARARKRDPFILWPIIAKLRLVVGVNSSRAPVCGKHSTYMFKWMALEWVSPIAFYLFDSPIKCPLRLLEKIKR